MGQAQISILFALTFVGVGAFVVLKEDAPPADSGQTASELASLRDEISGLSEDLKSLNESLAELHKGQINLADRVTSVPVPSASTEEGAPAKASMSKSALKGMVAAVLEQERVTQAEEREAQREEMRARIEERRKEQEALKEGPYDRYNVKINSLAGVLNLDDGQKQSYFDISAAYRTKLEEGMKELRAQREAARENGEEGGEGEDRRGGRRGGGGREEYRELYKTVQEQFAGEIQGILSDDQFATYSELSSDAQSFASRDEVRAPGEDRRGGFTRGTTTFGGGRNRGGGGGGRGGRGR